MKSNVAAVESKDHEEGVNRVLSFIRDDIARKVVDLDEIVIKVNFVDADVELATTPFEAVKTFIENTREYFHGKFIILEEATGGETWDAFDNYGYTDYAEQHSDVEIMNIGDDEVSSVTIAYPNGEISVPLSKKMTESRFLVSITRPKTHDTVVVTLGIKNVLVGSIQGKWIERSKVHQGKYIHQILTKISDYVFPDLSIIDGTIGMQGNGPVNGEKIKSNWTVASMDSLAADSVAASLMGFNTADIGYFNLLHEKEKGSLYGEDKIDLMGDDISELKCDFKPHDTFTEQRKWR